MLSKTISLLRDIPNVVSLSQANVDDYKLDDDQISQFYDGVKLFSIKAKNHMTYRYVDFHLNNNFKYLDIVSIPKYPLLAIYNKNTKRCLINISATLKTKVTNIDARDLYTMVAYGHCCSVFSNSDINSSYYEPFCSYINFMFLKIFSKKYGITGSYTDLIPQFKYIVTFYVLSKFFGEVAKEANKKAENLAQFDGSKLWKQLDPKNYDFSNIKDIITLLSDSGTCPGLGIYKFTETIVRLFGVMNLAIFDDLMRFCSAMFCSTINSNSFFPPNFQLSYSQQKFSKINEIMEHYL